MVAIWLFDRESGELELWAQKQHNDLTTSCNFETQSPHSTVEWAQIELHQRIPQYTDLHLWISTNASFHESDDDLEIYQLGTVPPLVTAVEGKLFSWLSEDTSRTSCHSYCGHGAHVTW